MPSTLSYPGVYVEEVGSGVRTITGVATSVTAFIGRARKGPVDDAVDITSYADFERRFGGLWLDSTMSYAVRDFFLNGGARAVIVRVFGSSFGGEDEQAVLGLVKGAVDAAKSGTDGKDAKAKAKEKLDAISEPAQKAAVEKAIKPIQDLADGADAAAIAAAADKVSADTKSETRLIDAGALKFKAVSPGAWGGNLRVETRKSEGLGAQSAADAAGLQKSDLFDLIVSDASPGGASETYLSVSVKNGPRRVDRVLKQGSALLRWSGADLDVQSASLPDIANLKSDDVVVAQKAWLEATKAEVPDKDVIKTKKDAYDKAVADARASVTDGGALTSQQVLGKESDKSGLYLLEKLYARDGIFNLLCIPPYNSANNTDVGVIAAAAAYCEKRRAMLIVDPPSEWDSVDDAKAGFSDESDQLGTRSKNAALFFPRLNMPNPLHENQIETFAPCGVVAGVFARTDTQRGIWKSPAGLDAGLVGVSSLSVPMTDEENGLLNPLGINCLRTFPVFGRVVWGARTLRGADAFADEYKYIAVRRTALYIEESLYRALKWVVFEPNDEPLWAQIRLNVGAFMHNLFRQGAFQGASSRDAYFVRCDATTTTQNDINLGIVNVNVGFAPLKPAEFVVIKLQQIAGQIET